MPVAAFGSGFSPRPRPARSHSGLRAHLSSSQVASRKTCQQTVRFDVAAITSQGRGERRSRPT
eukprot:766963-Pyramimonas_sp.AAC.1